MDFDMHYLAVVFNSTIRMLTPILYVTLGSALCNRVFIFNIGLEGTMLTGAFVAIVINYYTGSAAASLLGAMIASMLISLIAGIFMVRFKGAMLVVGVSINVLMGGLTTFFMQYIFGVKGAVVSDRLVGLTKVDVSWLKGMPTLQTMFGSLTYIDYFAFVLAVLIYIFLFKTVWGFRLRSVGINISAAKSLGIKAEQIQIATVAFSGVLSGIGGCLLTMGGVTMFAQNITAGRGFIAMAAASLGAAHPLGCIVSSAFFGFAQSISNMLQNSQISNELTMAIPYAATIIALAIYNYIGIKREKN
ncbi:ABC transporter permease [Oscillospiraceae bacterium PP1C4]